MTKMNIRIYGKETCPACHEAQDNINKVISEGKLEETVKIEFFDIEKDASAKAKFIMLSPDNKYPVIVMEDLEAKQSSKVRGIAPSVFYVRQYFKEKGYIQ
jgi:glutaredoxin